MTFNEIFRFFVDVKTDFLKANPSEKLRAMQVSQGFWDDTIAPLQSHVSQQGVNVDRFQLLGIHVVVNGAVPDDVVLLRWRGTDRNIKHMRINLK